MPIVEWNEMSEKTLTDSERYTVVNALRLAAEEFEKHAAEFGKVAAYIRAGNDYPMFASGEGGAVAADRLKVQFERQAKEARELMEKMEEWG